MMDVELRVQQVLGQNGITKPNLSQLEREIGVPRQALKRMISGNEEKVNLSYIGKFCDWLVRKNFSGDIPGCLLGFRPSSLLGALSDPGEVDVYVGEYQQQQSTRLARSWLAAEDQQLGHVFRNELRMFSDVAGRTTDSDDHGRASPHLSRAPLEVEWVYVPCRVPPDPAAKLEAPAYTGTTSEAKDCFRAMRHRNSPRTSILIGSHRANPLVELFLADLFKVTPFAGHTRKAPFYLYKLNDDPNRIRSTFGGPTLPSELKDLGENGLYFRTNKGRVEFWPSRPGERDAEVVIVRRDPSKNQVEASIFGVSKTATALMGQVLRDNPDRFWNPTQQASNGVQVSASVCLMTMKAKQTMESASNPFVVDDVTMVPFDLDTRARRKAG